MRLFALAGCLALLGAASAAAAPVAPVPPWQPQVRGVASTRPALPPVIDRARLRPEAGNVRWYWPADERRYAEMDDLALMEELGRRASQSPGWLR